MKRIKTLCVILLIIFFGSLYQGAVLPFIEGVKYGFAIAKYEIDTQNDTDDFLMMDVVSKDADYMETTEVNKKREKTCLYVLPMFRFWCIRFPRNRFGGLYFRLFMEF